MMLRRPLIFVLLVGAAFAATTAAHPLGNFSVNQFSRIEADRSQVSIRQVLDLAEIPTFQFRGRIDADRDGNLSQTELNAWLASMTPQYLAKLDLKADGERFELRSESSEISLGTGAGDLSTLRIAWNLAAAIPASSDAQRISFKNGNYSDRLGWNEMVVTAQGGVSVFDSTAFGSAVTDELKAFPQDLISAPLAERSAEYSYAAGAVPAGAVPLKDRNGVAAIPVQRDKFAELIAVTEITPLVILAGLFVAFGLGALHAMSPGHGKTVVGAYLVGSKGTPKHAIFLGLVVTVTHTLAVFMLGLITLFASNYVLPERVMPFLSFVSGLLVFFIGISLFKDRLFGNFGWGGEPHSHGHPHTHANDHVHAQERDGHTHTHDGLTHSHGGSTHSHLPPNDISLKSLLGLGISGGLLPCPSALVLMLSAISLGRVGYGLVLTLVFSLGLATTLTSVGLAFLYVGKVFGGTSLSQNRLFKAVPVFSSLVVACTGAVICYNSLG